MLNEKLKKKFNYHQELAVNQAYKELMKNERTIIRMATGTGKTEVGIKLFEKFDTTKDKRLLWLTHQNELITQFHDRVLNRAISKDDFENADIGIFNSELKDVDNKIIIASIQTINKSVHLKRFNPNDFDMIIMDEAHHSAALTWSKAINYFNGYKVGLTATPYRPDGQDIGTHFGNISCDIDFKKAQELGLLAPEQARVVITNSVIEGLVTTNGEYSPKQLERIYMSGDRNDSIVKSYKKYARQEVIDAKMTPKTICFCINIQHAKRMAMLFKSEGFSAEYVCSDLKEEGGRNRHSTLEKFIHSNEIEIICTVNLLNEGIDIPNANIGLLCRPTQSVITYTQQVGRISRYKKFFYLMDYVDQTSNEFQTYTFSKMTNTNMLREKIITEYLNENDSVVKDEIVKNVMEKANNFEIGMRQLLDTSKITEKNLIKWIKNKEFRPWVA